VQILLHGNQSIIGHKQNGKQKVQHREQSEENGDLCKKTGLNTQSELKV